MEITAKHIAGAVAGLFALLALGAGIADRRARKRYDFDRVSLFDWRNVQVFALIGAGLALWAIAAV